MADEFQDEPIEEQLVEEQPAASAGDVEMGNGAHEADNNDGSSLPFANSLEDAGELGELPADQRNEFVDYLKSPIVTLIVGNGVDVSILTAHQQLLVQSPFFADACASFSNDGSVSFLASVSLFSPRNSCGQLELTYFSATTNRTYQRKPRCGRQLP